MNLRAIPPNEIAEALEKGYIFVPNGGGVPRGHYVLFDGRQPFIPPMTECHSVPLLPSDIVVDIGAYVGTYAFWAARHGKVAHVIAYEPTRKSYDVIMRNEIDPNLTVVNAAVIAGHEPSVDFYVSRGIGVTNGLVPSTLKDKCTVAAVNYAEAVAGATVVKIDIEGGEYDLPIIQPGVRAYIIDFHPVGKDWIAKAQAIIATLENVGFKAIIKPNFTNGWTRAGSWVK